MPGESSESNNEMNSHVDEQDVVPESLLAMAKDARYVRACQHLVQNVLKAFSENPSSSSSSNETLTQQATLISSVLYALLVLSHHKKTFGMLATGLQYSTTTTTHNNNRALRLPKWKLVTTVALATAVARYWAQRRCRSTVLSSIHYNNNNNNMTESLRGQSRRDYFEAQRRAMLERARATDASTTRTRTRTRTHQPATTTTNRRSASPYREAWSRRYYWRFGTNTILSILTSQPLEEPHEVHNHDGSADNHDNTAIIISPPTSTTRSSSAVAIWLLRLHLAFYCLNGRYATWTHRIFFNSSFEATTTTTTTTTTTATAMTAKNNDDSSRLVHRPTTYRAVGLLILAQALGEAVQATIQSVVRSWIDSSTRASGTAYSLSSTITSAVQQPSIDFGGKCSTLSTQHRSCNDDDDSSSSSSSLSCDICHQPRRYPACPAACGHVFCWTCLQQWVTTVRPECPLCRAKCQSQEIVALYHYA